MIDETKLRELIAEWRKPGYAGPYVVFYSDAYEHCADQLSALLEETK